MGGDPSFITYDKNAKTHRMKKMDYDDTFWYSIKKGEGIGYYKSIFEVLFEDEVYDGDFIYY